MSPTYEQKALNQAKFQTDKDREKFERRWKSRMGRNIYPHGFGTRTAFVHDAINTRADMVNRLENVKDLIWRIYAFTQKDWDIEWLNNAGLYATWQKFNHGSIKNTPKQHTF